jgi:putative hydrolase of the HAD superfamily
MLELAGSIKRSGYKTGIITDNKQDRMDCIAGHFMLRQTFDSIIVSAAIGSGKESAAIFFATLKQLAVESEACVFIDNREENLAVPRSLGMQTIFYEHAQHDVPWLKRELRDMGVRGI